MRRFWPLLLLAPLAGCVHRAPHAGYREEGLATYYARSLEGHRTASGRPYRADRLTCAHRTLPFGTVLEVHRLRTPYRVRVVVTDRGPYVAGRIIDLSWRAARRLHMLGKGVVRVRLRVIHLGHRR